MTLRGTLHYGLAALLVGFAVLATPPGERWIGSHVAPLLLAAVALAAWCGGLGPGLLATALAAVATAYFYFGEMHYSRIETLGASRLVIFLLAALLITGLSASRGRVQTHIVAQSQDQSDSALVDRTSALSASNVALQQEIDERVRAEERLLSHQRRLRDLASELALAEERERRRIATRLHDDVGQMLSVVQMKVDALGDAPSPGEVAAAVSDLHDLLERTVARTRTLTCELSPPVLHELGLVPALEWLADQTQAQSGVAMSFRAAAGLPEMDEASRILLFQIVRELLRNMVKHARATHGIIRVAAEDGWEVISVADDGVGFNRPTVLNQRSRASTDSFGLFSIRERLRHHGGQLDVDSQPGEGARFTVRLPADRPSSRGTDNSVGAGSIEKGSS